MLNVRFHPDPDRQHGLFAEQGGDRLDSTRPAGSRFNVLLTEDRPREESHWTRQLPRLLAPQGVTAFIARTGKEAVACAERVAIHAAVIDLATPLSDADSSQPAVDPTQLWLLELFRRLPQRPPTVVLHGGFFSQRKVDRILSKALRLGAFSVLAKPVDLEQLLRVFQRMVDRRYAGAWPAPNSAGPPNDTTT